MKRVKTARVLLQGAGDEDAGQVLPVAAARVDVSGRARPSAARELVRLAYGEPQDVAEAARLEVDWWRAHRERQRPTTRTDSPEAGTAEAGTAERRSNPVAL